MDLLYFFHRLAIQSAFQVVYGLRPYGRNAAFLERSQWWDYERITDFQSQKLQNLITHAYNKVPFYHNRMKEARVIPADIQRPGDLAAIPLLTKQDIQTNLSDLFASGISRKHLWKNHTGGSTGHPLTIYQDANYLAWANADLLRNYRMTGYELGKRWAFLWGSDYDAKTHKGWTGRLKDRIIYNTLWINTFDLQKQTIRKAVDDLACWNPEYLVAYVSSATLMARVILERGASSIRPKAIQTSAEVLTTADREIISRAFGAPVFDRYGCREVGNIAHECNHHLGLHVLMENNLLELVDAQGNPVAPGEMGRVVITNLNNYGMPLIRYENGDMAVFSAGTCTCGRGLPLISQVIGRTSDIITSPSGKLLHGEFFTHLFYKIEGVQQFRVVQETLETLKIQIIPGSDFKKEMVFTFLENTIHQHGDPGFNVQFSLHEVLPPAASGKYRFTESKIDLKLV